MACSGLAPAHLAGRLDDAQDGPLHLAEAGLKVVVLEAARVGWGASDRNGRQIVHSYSRDLDVIERRYGVEQARALGTMAFEGAQDHS